MLHSEIPSSAGVSAETVAAVRGSVGEALARSPAVRALPPKKQREIAAHTVRVLASLAAPDAARRAAPSAGPETAAPAEHLTRQVSFPAFAGGLIQGVFQAIVNASIQQMEAYAELIASVSASLDSFVEEVGSEREPRPGEEADEKQAASRRELASNRQQLLATMVLMGINRIMKEGEPHSGSPGETTDRRTPTRETGLSFKSDYLPLDRM